MEVEDSVLNELHKKAAGYDAASPFQAMFDKIGKSKDRGALLKLVKEHFPDTVIPEIDAAKPVYDELDKLKAELAEEREIRAKEKAEREKAETETKANRTIADQRKSLREDGWDDEGIEKIEAYMRETQNPDYKSAAAYIRTTLDKPAPLPSTFAGQRFDWFRAPEASEDHKLLLKNPRAYQDAEISKWLSEQRRR